MEGRGALCMFLAGALSLTGLSCTQGSERRSTQFAQVEPRPGDAGVAYDQAQRHLDAGNYLAARDYFVKAMQINEVTDELSQTYSRSIPYTLGLIYVELGDFANAMRSYERLSGQSFERELDAGQLFTDNEGGMHIETHVLAFLKALIYHEMQNSVGYVVNPITGEYRSCDKFAMDTLHDFLSPRIVTPNSWGLADEIVKNGNLSPAERRYYRAILSRNLPGQCHRPPPRRKGPLR